MKLYDAQNGNFKQHNFCGGFITPSRWINIAQIKQGTNCPKSWIDLYLTFPFALPPFPHPGMVISSYIVHGHGKGCEVKGNAKSIVT